MYEDKFTLIPYIKVCPGYFCTYKYPYWNVPKPSVERKKVKMPESNKHDGNISKRAASRIKKGINWMLFLANDKELPSKVHGRTFKFKLSFITLTLSSQQLHTDNEIKKTCLNHFLVEARRKWNVKNYLWRAEPQKNGNIHFHVLCDKFVPWSELRDVWNNIQNKLGYVDRYRSKMREYYADGFKVKTEFLPKWSLADQRRAFNRNVKSDWNSPNSTDVHAIHKINNIAAYLSKYCTKETKGRKIEGNLWNLSESLSKLSGYVTEVECPVASEIAYLQKTCPDSFYHAEYYSIGYFNVRVFSDIENSTIWSGFLNYVAENT